MLAEWAGSSSPDEHPETWRPLLEAARSGDVSLLFGTRDAEHSNAVVLRDYLLARVRNESGNGGASHA